MSSKIVKRALELFDEPKHAVSKSVKMNVTSEDGERKKWKKRKSRKSVVEIYRMKQQKNLLEDNLQSLQMFTSKRKPVKDTVDEIIKGTCNSKKQFIFGKKHKLKTNKMKKEMKKDPKKSVFDEGDFKTFFKEYQG